MEKPTLGLGTTLESPHRSDPSFPTPFQLFGPFSPIPIIIWHQPCVLYLPQPVLSPDAPHPLAGVERGNGPCHGQRWCHAGEHGVTGVQQWVQH